MSETTKTLVFIFSAAAVVTAAVVGTRPVEFDVAQMVGEKLTDDFDVDVPKRLQIVTFDQSTASTREFEVEETDGSWRIPSKQGYPADATDQMAAAATCLVGREVLRIAAQDADQHEEFGVVDPTSPNLDTNSAGVGMRVTMADASDEQLIDLIIGNKVKGSEDVRYVRRRNQDIVFEVELDADKLTTDFEDWIEDDLLQLNPFDVRQVFINDYSFDLTPMQTQRGIEIIPEWDRRGRYEFAYKDNKWEVNELEQFDAQEEDYEAFELQDSEEINEEALNSLRDAFDDLKIVDVERKPEGLSGSLKAGEELIKNQEAAESLFRKGFTPLAGADGKPELTSSEGEVTCTTREGVKYILRFGDLKLQTEESASASDADSAENQEDAEDADNGIHRYIFVMAEFDEAAIERPELEDLPELPAEDSADASEATDAAETEDNTEPAPAESDDAEVASEAATGEGEAEEQTEEKAEEEEEEEEGAAGAATAPADDSAASAEAVADDEGATEENTGESGADEEQAEDAPKDESEAGSSADDASEGPDDSATAAVIAERKRIERENQRKLDEYQETIESGQKKVKQLNARFGDWYYVISNDVFKKIHLGRDELIKPAETEEGDEATEDGSTPLPNLPIGAPQ